MPMPGQTGGVIRFGLSPICKSTTVSKIIKMLHIFFRYFKVFLCSHLIRAQTCIDITIYVFTVNRYHTSSIFCLFHSSLDFKAKTQAEKLEREIEAKEKEIYDLKHDLIAEQIQSENDKKEIKRLDTENRELLLNKARLESSLEESLLGKIEEDASDEDETEQEDTTD
jgi:cell division protein FtsB